MKVKTSTGKLIQSTAVEGQAQEQQDPETVADAIAGEQPTCGVATWSSHMQAVMFHTSL